MRNSKVLRYIFNKKSFKMKTKDEFRNSIREAFLPLDVSWYLMKRAVLKMVDVYCVNPDAEEHVIEILESDSERVFSDFNSLPLFCEILKEIGIPAKNISMQGNIIKMYK